MAWDGWRWLGSGGWRGVDNSHPLHPVKPAITAAVPNKSEPDSVYNGGEPQNSAFDLKTATLSSKLDSRFEASRRDGSH